MSKNSSNPAEINTSETLLGFPVLTFSTTQSSPKFADFKLYEINVEVLTKLAELKHIINLILN